jgi:cell division protein FtsA
MSGLRFFRDPHREAQSAAENTDNKCVRRCTSTCRPVDNRWASSSSVLTQDEQKTGCTVDTRGHHRRQTSSPWRHPAHHDWIGGDLITSDIATALRTPTKDAEDIKVGTHGSCRRPRYPGRGARPGRRASRMSASKRRRRVIEPRVEEIYLLDPAVAIQPWLRGSAVRHCHHRRQRHDVCYDR